MIARYLAFAGTAFYPTGGMQDCHGQFFLFEEAEAAIIAYSEDCTLDDFGYPKSPDAWAYIYDIVTRQTIGKKQEDVQSMASKVKDLSKLGLEEYQKQYGEAESNLIRLLEKWGEIK